MRHEKTCIELKNVKSTVENLKKEMNQSSVIIKTLKKEAKEADSQHQKIVKKKDDTIHNLQVYKSEKQSEERDLKTKEKKVRKKMKTLEEREAKLCLLKKDLNRVEVKVEPNNNDESGQTWMNSTSYRPSNCVESISMVSLNSINTINSFPSIVSHWLPLPAGTVPLMDTTCSLETIKSLHPTNSNLLTKSSLDTTPISMETTSTSIETTSSSMDTITTCLVASSSLDNPCSQASTNYDEEREMLKAMLKVLEEMIILRS
jgi:hypothetical protein